jgi:glycosyltransferase involved in cell wall biosynthesis
MPRLLIVATISDTIGAFMLPFGQHFRSQGWRVDAMAKGVSNSPECKQAFDAVWDMDWSRNPLDPRNLITVPKPLREIVLGEKYDLVHVHTPVAAFVTRLALRELRNQGKIRVVYTAHGFHFYRGAPVFKAFSFRSLEKLAGRWTDFLVVINQEDSEAARRLRLVPPERIRFMPGIGVDLRSYGRASISESERQALRNKLQLAPSDRLFLVVAEFIPRKRHVDVLRAMAILNRSEVRVAFAGNGPLVEEMKALASQLGILEKVRFLGFRKDITALMSVSEALLLPSLAEGLPRSILEAHSNGLPVIGSSIRGTRDLLENGKGLLVPVRDPARLAESMRWVLEHAAEARRMGLAAQRGVSKYSIENVLSAHEELYAEALGTPGRQERHSRQDRSAGAESV